MSDTAITSTFETDSEEDTAAIGERMAASLTRGDVVLLYGELGAGKTAFVRGLARGLGASPDEVSSPTFTLVQEYRGRATLYHIDLYRLHPREVDDLGIDELATEGIVAVEWAERWADPPTHARAVRMEHAGDNRRRIVMTDSSESRA